MDSMLLHREHSKVKTLDEFHNPTEITTMAKLGEYAKLQEDIPKTLNISEIEKVSVDIEVKSETKTNSKGEQYTQDFIEVDGQKYRIPKSVLFDLKTMLEEKPDMTHFKVTRKGVGRDDTRYTVIPQ